MSLSRLISLPDPVIYSRNLIYIYIYIYIYIHVYVCVYVCVPVCVCVSPRQAAILTYLSVFFNKNNRCPQDTVLRQYSYYIVYIGTSVVDDC